MAKIIGINTANTSAQTTAHDPTCGSGSLLLKVADEAGKSITLYGQEKDSATSGLARMNMLFIYTLFNCTPQRAGRCRGSYQCRKFKGHKISLPALSEQTHIATILSDIDAEIAALEVKLTKYKQIKQGMMQELLTGRIRLI
jgi:hypothetical protein